MKYKIEQAVESMHYKSAKLVLFIRQSIQLHQLYMQNNVYQHFEALRPAIQKSGIYYSDNNFKIAFDSAYSSIVYIMQTLDNIVNSRAIPQIRSEFEMKLAVFKKKIEESKLKEVIEEVTRDFFEETQKKMSDFIEQTKNSKLQAQNREKKFNIELDIYLKLNEKKILCGKFDNEIAVLKYFTKLLGIVNGSLKKLQEKLQNSLVDLDTQVNMFFEEFLLDIEKRNKTILQKITKRYVKEDLTAVEEMPKQPIVNFKNAVVNIEDIPMPDFSTPVGKKTVEVVVNFPYSNYEIMDIALQWIQGKYNKQNITLQLGDIRNKRAILALVGPKDMNLESFKKEIIHDIISTINTIIKREKIALKVQANLEEYFLPKIIPKISYGGGDLNFVSYEKETGDLLLEYVNTHTEIEKMNKEDIQKILKECFVYIA